MKIFPSPMWPVRAAWTIDLDDLLGLRFVDEEIDLHLGKEVDRVLGAAVELRVPFWRPKPFTSLIVMPRTPMVVSASLTSSSLNGFTIAFDPSHVPSDAVPDQSNRGASATGAPDPHSIAFIRGAVASSPAS
jgi:hypothetical protein